MELWGVRRRLADLGVGPRASSGWVQRKDRKNPYLISDSFYRDLSRFNFFEVFTRLSPQRAARAVKHRCVMRYLRNVHIFFATPNNRTPQAGLRNLPQWLRAPAGLCLPLLVLASTPFN